mgnify:CR=1 FL=1
MKKRILNIFLMAAFIAMHSNVLGQDIEFSGFVDVQYAKSQSISEEYDQFQYGQFELDVSAPVNRWMTAEGAIALNPHEEKFEPGAGFFDINLLANRSPSQFSGKKPFLHTAGLWIGQFDVPFGIDYEVIPSVNRSLVHSPLINEQTIDCWNSVGMTFHASGSMWNIKMFGVNGFGDAVSLGGRVGLKLDRETEVGFSYSKDVFTESTNPHEIFGADIEWRNQQFTGKGEAIYTSGLYQGACPGETNMDAHYGFYFQGKYDVLAFRNHPFFLVGRIGSWIPENDFDIDGQKIEQVNRLTAGIGMPIGYNSEVRAEYLTDGQETSVVTMQLVVGF